MILVNLFRLRQGAAGVGFLHAYRVDLKGFAIGWGIALGLVATAWLIFRL